MNKKRLSELKWAKTIPAEDVANVIGELCDEIEALWRLQDDWCPKCGPTKADKDKDCSGCGSHLIKQEVIDMIRNGDGC